MEGRNEEKLGAFCTPERGGALEEGIGWGGHAKLRPLRTDPLAALPQLPGEARYPDPESSHGTD